MIEGCLCDEMDLSTTWTQYAKQLQTRICVKIKKIDIIFELKIEILIQKQFNHFCKDNSRFTCTGSCDKKITKKKRLSQRTNKVIQNTGRNTYRNVVRMSNHKQKKCSLETFGPHTYLEWSDEIEYQMISKYLHLLSIWIDTLIETFSWESYKI